jgi:uncharacterized membrane protein YhaH (DUF805 family)
MKFDFNRLYLTTTGRIGRAEFWVGILGIAIVAIVAVFVVAAVFGPLSVLAEVLVFLVELLLAYPTYAVMAKRFHDRARPAATAMPAIGIPLLTALLTLVGLTGSETGPNLLGEVLNFVNLVIAIWILLDLGILPGTRGDNQYGPDPTTA